MSQTKMFPARWMGGVAVVGLLLLIALILVGCGATEVATEPPVVEATATKIAAVTPTAEPTEPPAPTETPTEPPPTATPTEEPTEPPPTATPTEEPTPEVVDDSGCITCHTDEEALKSLATEEEEPEVESEGEG